MKRVFVSLSFVMIAGLTTVFASDGPNVSKKIQASFIKKFTGAESVKWNATGDYQMARFILKGDRFIAYFKKNGIFEGSGKTIYSFDKLPVAVIKSLRKNFWDAEFYDMMEVSNSEGVSYWLTVEVEGKKNRVHVGIAGALIQTDDMEK